MDAIIERAGRQLGQLPSVAVGKRDNHAIFSEIAQARKGICGKAWFGLLAIGNDWGAGSLQARDRVAKSGFLGGTKLCP